MRYFKHFVDFNDTLIITLMSVSLIQVHLILSCIALGISVGYTLLKFRYYLKHRINEHLNEKKTNEKNNNTTI